MGSLVPELDEPSGKSDLSGYSSDRSRIDSLLEWVDERVDQADDSECV